MNIKGQRRMSNIECRTAEGKNLQAVVFYSDRHSLFDIFFLKPARSAISSQRNCRIAHLQNAYSDVDPKRQIIKDIKPADDVKTTGRGFKRRQLMDTT